ncbi:hypothetical protein QZH41_016857 [Actinostola sp. cb2023]|nr:hypothetical protein QZH41_016857 [Actinostola sp. cb2023]
MAFLGNYICISIEALCFFGVIIFNAVLYEMMYLRKGGIQPFIRGFFCEDHYHEAVSARKLILSRNAHLWGCHLTNNVGNNFSKSKESRETEKDRDGRRVGPVLIPFYIIRMIHRMAIFGVGMALVMILCCVVAILAGRLRPHFLAVCKPNTALYNCSSGYIARDVCTGDPLLVKRARFSFPSGHTAISTYSMVFAAFCLQACVWLRKYKLFRIILQTALILLGFAVGLSRIRDYYHHWLDVVGGALIGAFAAWLVVSFAI